MGVNLVPLVRNFRIETVTFTATHCAVVERCTVPGTRKLLNGDPDGSLPPGVDFLSAGPPARRSCLHAITGALKLPNFFDGDDTKLS